jgi:hypothetical protein
VGPPAVVVLVVDVAFVVLVVVTLVVVVETLVELLVVFVELVVLIVLLELPPPAVLPVDPISPQRMFEKTTCVSGC